MKKREYVSILPLSINSLFSVFLFLGQEIIQKPELVDGFHFLAKDYFFPIRRPIHPLRKAIITEGDFVGHATLNVNSPRTAIISRSDHTGNIPSVWMPGNAINDLHSRTC